MGPLPIDSQTLWTPEKFFLLVEDEIRDFSFRLLPSDFFNRDVTEEAPRKKVFLVQ
jgi:hypothetical protein